MIRPPLEVAGLVRTAGTGFIERNRQWIRWPHIKVLLAIARCRTAALGGHIDECSRCGHRATISYNSYRNRHCPKCQTGAREHWLEARRRQLLPSPYAHVVFTLPQHLAPLALQNKKIIYDLLLRTSAETLLEVARNPRRLGAEIGFFSVLHTWNQKLQLHSHVHCVVPAGALARPYAMDSIPPSLLTSPPGAAARVSWQIRRRPQVRLPTQSAPLRGRSGTDRSAQDLRRLAASAIPQELGGLLQTTLRWPRIRAPVSGPLHPSRGHLQPSPDFVG